MHGWCSSPQDESWWRSPVPPRVPAKYSRRIAAPAQCCDLLGEEPERARPLPVLRTSCRGSQAPSRESPTLRSTQPATQRSPQHARGHHDRRRHHQSPHLLRSTHVAFGKCAVAFAPSHAHREGVLSIAKLAAGQQSYYLSSVADGTEEYYLGAGEAPGRWVASSQSSLGLTGEVVASDLHAVLEG